MTSVLFCTIVSDPSNLYIQTLAWLQCGYLCRVPLVRVQLGACCWWWLGTHAITQFIVSARGIECIYLRLTRKHLWLKRQTHQTHQPQETQKPKLRPVKILERIENRIYSTLVVWTSEVQTRLGQKGDYPLRRGPWLSFSTIVAGQSLCRLIWLPHHVYLWVLFFLELSHSVLKLNWQVSTSEMAKTKNIQSKRRVSSRPFLNM